MGGDCGVGEAVEVGKIDSAFCVISLQCRGERVVEEPPPTQVSVGLKQARVGDRAEAEHSVPTDLSRPA